MVGELLGAAFRLGLRLAARLDGVQHLLRFGRGVAEGILGLRIVAKVQLLLRRILDEPLAAPAVNLTQQLVERQLQRVVGLQQITVRLGFFAGVLFASALWELLLPRRRLTVAKAPRWASNLGLVVLNSVAARLLVPITAFAAAMLAESHGWGLLHQVRWLVWMEVVLAVLAFDLAIYLQHVMFHAVPVLWRLHMVHHADLDFDVTTGLRRVALRYSTTPRARTLAGYFRLAVNASGSKCCSLQTIFGDGLFTDRPVRIVGFAREFYPDLRSMFDVEPESC